MQLPENELRGYIENNGKPMWTAHNNHNIRYFKEEEIRIITNDYDTVLGKGGFGEVYKGALDDNSPVAVKRYIHNVKENFAKEVIVHCQINHRNVVRLIGCCIGENALMMVTEYMSKGNLSENLHCSEISISLETRLGIAIGCAEALSYMHSQMYGRVIHGDIKPDNILLDDSLNAKLSDFGISKLLSTDNPLYTSHVIGSIGYMDPLFVRSGLLTAKSDVYSFGVVLLELITRRKAVDDALIDKFTQALAKRNKIREFYDVNIADENNLRILDGIGKLAGKCLTMDLEKRPEMKDVAESLRMFRKAQYESQEKISLFGWIPRRKQSPQNMVPTDKHFLGNEVIKAVAQAQKVSEVGRDGSSQGIELEELLEGKYAVTYKAVLHDGFAVTVKRLKTIDVPEAVFKERVAAIGTIEHELIVPLRQYYYSKDQKLLVYDYFPNGSLASNLHGKDVAPMGWETRSAIALSVARAITFIHSTNVGAFFWKKNAVAASHGSLNSSNILLTGSYEARVSEHGLKALVSAPTLVIDNNIAQKDDVYSFGVILLEMLTGKSPILKPNLLEWVLALARAKWVSEAFDKILLTENTVVEEELVQFLTLAVHCCYKNPTMRPTMSEVAQQIEALRGADFSTAENRQLTGSNAGRDAHNVTVVREEDQRLYSFGSSQGIEVEELLRASAEVLGKGKYAVTYKAVLHDGIDFTVTVKRLNTIEDVPEAVFKERVAAIGTIEHELVVPLRQYYYSKDEKLLVYDYFPKGSLASTLHGKNVAPVGWETRSAIALSVAHAVAYIHSMNGAAASHGNLNSSNILLTRSYEARVSEHGLKTLVSDPTVVMDNNIAQKDDVYSFGVILLEMVTGKSPIPPILTEEPDLVDWVLSIPHEHWVAQAVDKKLLTKNTAVEDELVEFLRIAIQCCDKNPALRPTMSEVAQQIEEIHDFFTW